MARVIRDSDQVEIQTAFGANVSGTVGVFTASDTTPSVATGNIWETGSNVTITTFDGGVVGQIITVISRHDVIYDVGGTNLKAGSTNITTASGDATTWVYNGTDWFLINFLNVSENLSTGH
jgi:hypothetical protein